MSTNHLRGHLEMLVLAVLSSRPLHGYGVSEHIRNVSGGIFDLPEGSLYPALYRLERDALVASRWSVENGRRRRIYAITRAGRSALARKSQQWTAVTAAVDAVLGGRAWAPQS